jgi:hypothetical protein
MGLCCVCSVIADCYQVECFKIIASGLFKKSTQDVVLLGNVVTGDESQVFTYDPETK